MIWPKNEWPDCGFRSRKWIKFSRLPRTMATRERVAWPMAAGCTGIMPLLALRAGNDRPACSRQRISAPLRARSASECSAPAMSCGRVCAARWRGGLVMIDRRELAGGHQEDGSTTPGHAPNTVVGDFCASWGRLRRSTTSS